MASVFSPGSTGTRKEGKAGGKAKRFLLSGRAFGMIGLVLFVYILTRISASEIVSAVMSASPALVAAAFALTIFPFIARSLRWRYIVFTMTGRRLQLPGIMALWSGSVLLGLFTPGRIGELFLRAGYVRKEAAASMGKSLSGVFVDRMADLAAMAVVGITGALYISYLGAGLAALTAALALCLFLAAAFFAVSVRKRSVIDYFLRSAYNRFVPERSKKGVRSNYHDFFEGFKRIDRKALPVLAFYSVFSLLSAGASYYLIASALGMGLTFWHVLVVSTIATIVTLIPVSVSGIGTREAAYILLFSLSGIAMEKALLFSLMDLFLINWGAILMCCLLSHVLVRLRSSRRMR